MSSPGYWQLIATTAGIEWAAEVLSAADRRSWSGTVSDARARLDAVWRMLSLEPDASAREHLARHTHDAARTAWRSFHATPSLG